MAWMCLHVSEKDSFIQVLWEESQTPALDCVTDGLLGASKGAFPGYNLAKEGH